MVSLPNMMKRGVCMKNDGNTKRSFPGYGLLDGIDFDSYMLDLIYWVYEDDIDGYLIVRNELTGEFRYVERDEL